MPCERTRNESRGAALGESRGTPVRHLGTLHPPIGDKMSFSQSRRVRARVQLFCRVLVVLATATLVGSVAAPSALAASNCYDYGQPDLMLQATWVYDANHNNWVNYPYMRHYWHLTVSNPGLYTQFWCTPAGRDVTNVVVQHPLPAGGRLVQAAGSNGFSCLM